MRADAVVRHAIPNLATARSAYVHGTIELEDFERLAGAALANQPTHIPDAVARLYFADAFHRAYDGPGGYAVPMVLPDGFVIREKR
jgi:hypothetical protein